MPPMSTTRLILVGGFLGAGKTTLLAQAAGRLRPRADAWDWWPTTRPPTWSIRRSSRRPARGRGGGGRLLLLPLPRHDRRHGAPGPPGAGRRAHRRAGGQLHRPVGHGDAAAEEASRRANSPWRRSPCWWTSTRCACWPGCGRPRRPSRRARFPDNVFYIYEKQLEEADLIVLNKADLLSAAELAELKGSLAERFPDTPLLAMSALTGEGVDAWLDFLSRGAGGREDRRGGLRHLRRGRGRPGLDERLRRAWPPAERRTGRRWPPSCWRRFAAACGPDRPRSPT